MCALSNPPFLLTGAFESGVVKSILNPIVFFVIVCIQYLSVKVEIDALFTVVQHACAHTQYRTYSLIHVTHTFTFLKLECVSRVAELF